MVLDVVILPIYKYINDIVFETEYTILYLFFNRVFETQLIIYKYIVIGPRNPGSQQWKKGENDRIPIKIKNYFLHVFYTPVRSTVQIRNIQDIGIVNELISYFNLFN